MAERPRELGDFKKARVNVGTDNDFLNPFNASCSKLLLFRGSSPILVNPPFLIFNIRALWRSVLSARAPECQKLKMVG